MTTQLNIADLLFLQAQVVRGPNNPPGTDPLTLLGTRTIDGTQNNLTHTTIVDQYGHAFSTDTIGNVDHPFFYVTPAPLTGFAADGVTQGGTFYRGGVGVAGPVNYAQNLSPTDDSPRLISDVVASSDLTATNFFNPAAAAAQANPFTPSVFGNAGNDTLFILPTNALFTFFGQFLDHGLDFINKGGNGTVTGDNLMMNRATLHDVNPETGLLNTRNASAPFVEQSQTYGQRASTTFYLMEYDATGAVTGTIGAPTGRLVTHSDGTMATWADIKANALIKGVVLTDAHVFNVPDPITLLPTGQALLADIAHFAAPSAGLLPDPDGTTGNIPAAGFYDNELLDVHKVAGDGRVNENVVLASIHAAFHAEHNRLVLQIEDLIAQQDLLTPGFASQWDGARIFDAAKLVNEMQYQHFVFEEFARRLSPNIDAFAQYDVTINPNISLEFSQAVYRLGHSMLTDSVDTINAAGQFDTMSLIAAFLNPVAFDALGAANIVEGQTRQAMNQIDEFAVNSVRNFLFGSMDLISINIARGRDVLLPTLNQTRQELFNQTLGQVTSLAPYTSWDEFRLNLLHPESLDNFVAAYARAGTVLGDAIVTARQALIDVAVQDSVATQTALANLRLAAAAATADAAFMAGGDLGFWDIDLWVGGLAEAKVSPGLTSVGMLGTTFDFIFATQLKSLQDGDRLYYLARLGGTNILDEIEGKKFGELLATRNGAIHTNGDIFGVASEYIELSSTPALHTFTTAFSNSVPYHEVVGGTTLADTITTGAGNDTVWGEDGADIINAGNGADIIYGGDGNDQINAGPDNDFVRGDAGDDTIFGDLGNDIIFANDGNDTVFAGPGFDEVFGGLGDDTIDGGDQDDALFGQEGDDILNGGLGNDALDGGPGNDLLTGDQGTDTLIGGADNNVLIGGAGGDVLDGFLGLYDLATYATPAGGGSVGLTIDMAGALSTGDALGDTFIAVEELRGTAKNDIILGDAFGNVLSGGGGSDTLNGGAGDDTIYSNAGTPDNLIGGAGIDLGVWLGVQWLPATNGGVSPSGHTVTVSVNALGDGTVTIDSVTDQLSGVEQLSFDNGIWSPAGNQWVPLIGVTSSATQVVGGHEIDGNLVNTTAILDNTLIPLTGIYVGDVEILDPDGPNGLQAVTLAGADAASFQLFNVLGPTGDVVQELRFIGGRLLGDTARINYEGKMFYHVTLNVADGSGGSAINYTLNITDINDNAPLMTSPDRANVRADASTDVVVYRATATDRDTATAIGQSPLMYALAAVGAGNDNALFAMTNNGEARFMAPPAAGVYTIEVEAFDGIHTTTKFAEVVVSPPPGPQPPNAPSDSDVVLPANTIAQGAAPGTYVGITAFASDPNGDTVTYSLTDDAGGRFQIDANSGVVTVAPGAVIGLGPYTVDVRANDGALDSLTDTTFTIVVTPAAANNPPAAPADSNAAPDSVAEGAANGTPVGITAAALDGDGDGVVYSLTNSAGGRFEINPITGVVTVADGSLINFETATSHIITAQASDGVLPSVTTNFTIDVTNVAPGAPADGNVAANSVVHGAANGTAVGITATAADVNGGALVYSLTNSAGGRFQINPGTGVVTVANGLLIDFTTATSHIITVQASDGGLPSVTTNFTINVTPPAGATIVGTNGADLINATNTVAGQPLPTAGNDTITGRQGGDTIDGGFGNDTLRGNNGNDNLTGGPGNDTMSGGLGIDTFMFAANFGNDTITGFIPGTDLLNLTPLGITAADFGARVAIVDIGADTVVTVDGTDTMTFTGVNGVGANAITQPNFILAPAALLALLATPLPVGLLATSAGASIVGTNSADIIDATSTVAGQLLATAGNDSISGRQGDDTIDGGAGNDTLRGNKGNDTLIGGLGDDTMAGGRGIDAFVFATNFGNDTIIGFETGVDLLDLRPLGITAIDFGARVSSVDNAGDALITVDGGDPDGGGTITLAAINFAGVAINDFILA